MSKKEHKQVKIRIDDVLKRLSAITGLTTNAELGKAICGTRTTVYEWRRNNQIPYKHLIAYAVKEDISLDYLLLGRDASKARIQKEETFGERLAKLEKAVAYHGTRLNKLESKKKGAKGGCLPGP